MAPIFAYLTAGLIVGLLVLAVVQLAWAVAELQALREYLGTCLTGHDTLAELRELKSVAKELVRLAEERTEAVRTAERRYEESHPYRPPTYAPEA